MTDLTRSICCNESISRPGHDGPWYCDNCGGEAFGTTARAKALAAQVSDGQVHVPTVQPMSHRVAAEPPVNLGRITAHITQRAIEMTVVSDKATLADDGLAEVRAQASLETLVWVLSLLTGDDEGTVMAQVLTEAP